MVNRLDSSSVPGRAVAPGCGIQAAPFEGVADRTEISGPGRHQWHRQRPGFQVRRSGGSSIQVRRIGSVKNVEGLRRSVTSANWHQGRPITLGANTAPTETAAWKTIPSWAVVGTEDRVIPPATQRSMAERAGSTITEVAGSHVSMVSHPAAAIEAILAAVAAIDD